MKLKKIILLVFSLSLLGCSDQEDRSNSISTPLKGDDEKLLQDQQFLKNVIERWELYSTKKADVESKALSKMDLNPSVRELYNFWTNAQPVTKESTELINYKPLCYDGRLHKVESGFFAMPNQDLLMYFFDGEEGLVVQIWKNSKENK